VELRCQIDVVSCISCIQGRNSPRVGKLDIKTAIGVLLPERWVRIQKPKELQSLACGTLTICFGAASSTALGIETTASGEYSIASGNQSKAFGFYSPAMGAI
jgi:hypothetical protein